MYQLFVGEIGFPRKEFLEELLWWEIRSIIRGYNARSHTSWEQTRLVAWQVHYCMGVPKDKVAKSQHDWLPFSWDYEPPKILPSEDEIKALQEDMKNVTW